MLLKSKKFRIFLQFVFSAMALWWLFDRLGAKDVWSYFSKISPTLLVAGVVVYALAQVLSAWRWRIISRVFGFAGNFGNYNSLYFLGMFYNIFLPTGYGGDVVKALYQAKDRTPASKTLAAMTILLDRFGGLVALLLLGGVASWGLKSQMGFYGHLMAWGFLACVILAPAALMAAGRIKFLPRKLRFIVLALRAKGHRFWGVAGLSIIVQLLNVAIYAALMAELGANLTLMQVTFSYAIVTLATLLPVSIGGLGVRESGWAAMLLAFGAPPEAGVSAGLLYFFIQSAASLIGVVPFWRSVKDGSK